MISDPGIGFIDAEAPADSVQTYLWMRQKGDPGRPPQGPQA